MKKLVKKQTGGQSKVKKSSSDSAFKAASNKIEKARAIGDSLAKKSILKKAQVGMATTPSPVKPIAPISPRMQKAVADSTAGAQFIAQHKAKYKPDELQGSIIKPKMEAAARALKRPANVRVSERQGKVTPAEIADNRKKFLAPSKKGGAVKSKKK